MFDIFWCAVIGHVVALAFRWYHLKEKGHPVPDRYRRVWFWAFRICFAPFAGFIAILLINQHLLAFVVGIGSFGIIRLMVREVDEHLKQKSIAHRRFKTEQDEENENLSMMDGRDDDEPPSQIAA